MELLKGGELVDELTRLKKFTEKDAATVTKTVIHVLAYLHSHQMIHRDIKAENIVLEEAKSLDSLKVVDFGCATKYRKDKLLVDLVGSPYYVAPEVMNGKYNEKCDIWSTGVLVYFMLTGLFPFDSESDEGLEAKIKT